MTSLKTIYKICVMTSLWGLRRSENVTRQALQVQSRSQVWQPGVPDPEPRGGGWAAGASEGASVPWDRAGDGASSRRRAAHPGGECGRLTASESGTPRWGGGRPSARRWFSFLCRCVPRLRDPCARCARLQVRLWDRLALVPPPGSQSGLFASSGSTGGAVEETER